LGKERRKAKVARRHTIFYMAADLEPTSRIVEEKQSKLLSMVKVFG